MNGSYHQFEPGTALADLVDAYWVNDPSGAGATDEQTRVGPGARLFSSVLIERLMLIDRAAAIWFTGVRFGPGASLPPSSGCSTVTGPRRRDQPRSLQRERVRWTGLRPRHLVSGLPPSELAAPRASGCPKSSRRPATPPPGFSGSGNGTGP